MTCNASVTFFVTVAADFFCHRILGFLLKHEIMYTFVYSKGLFNKNFRNHLVI